MTSGFVKFQGALLNLGQGSAGDPLIPEFTRHADMRLGDSIHLNGQTISPPPGVSCARIPDNRPIFEQGQRQPPGDGPWRTRPRHAIP